MVKRSLYYLSKMYEEQLGEGEDYSKLCRTICINILNFKYLKTERNLLDVLDDETISLKTGLSIEGVKRLRK